jgi:hypothetical protein
MEDMDARQAQNVAREALASGDYADAVRSTMDWIAKRFKGRAVEVRVPPYRVVQVLGGTTHRRGTPPAVVEMDPATWLELLSGVAKWHELRNQGRIHASGERSDLSEIFSDSAE